MLWYICFKQVAEYGEEGEVVGVIRGCVKTVTRGNSAYVKLAYVLGLRVSPRHRFYSMPLCSYVFVLLLHCTLSKNTDTDTRHDTDTDKWTLTSRHWF